MFSQSGQGKNSTQQLQDHRSLKESYDAHSEGSSDSYAPSDVVSCPDLIDATLSLYIPPKGPLHAYALSKNSVG